MADREIQVQLVHFRSLSRVAVPHNRRGLILILGSHPHRDWVIFRAGARLSLRVRCRLDSSGEAWKLLL